MGATPDRDGEEEPVTDQADIRVEEVVPGEFAVTITEGDSTTRHRVVVPAGVGVPGVPDEEVVAESVRFLLEREPKERIQAAFDLPQIGRFFPDYPREIRRRLGGH